MTNASLLAEIPAVLDALEAGAQRAKTASGVVRGRRRGGGRLEADRDDVDPLLRKWRLPDLDLGIKPSYTTKQWRERERRMHKRALGTMRSSVAQSVEKHMAMMKRQEEIHSLGANNKAHALELQLAKLRRENDSLALRLAKVQQAETEITATNMPSRRPHVKASRDRKRFLDTSRRAAQLKLERENAQILQRLINARPSVKPRQQMLSDFKNHKKVSKNMCRLAVPPDASRNRQAAGSRRRPLPRLSTNATAPALPTTPGLASAYGDASSRLGSAHAPFRRPISRSTAATYQSASTSGTLSQSHAPAAHGAPRPMSKEEHRAQHARDRADWSTIHSSEDRGQLCHQRVRIPHVRAGEQPVLLDALLIGFKHPKEADELLFEVTAGPVTRYAKVSYGAMRLALEEASVKSPQVITQGVNLAEAAAAHLRFFGDDSSLMLVWQNAQRPCDE